MKGDFTRLTFDRKKHYRGVLMQQGRVQLDSDWNEQVQIAEHRYSTFFGDLVGQSGAPADNSMAILQKRSDALNLGSQTFITVAQLSSSLTGKAAATIQLWFRSGSTIHSLKDNLRSTAGCIVSLDEIAGFGIADDGSPAVRFLTDAWQKIDVGRNVLKVNEDNWHFLAIVFRKNFSAKTCEIVIYLDGKQAAERSGSFTKAMLDEKSQILLNSLVLGAWSDNKTYYFGGDIADLRIWDGQIENPGALPVAALTGKEQGLVRYYPLNEQEKATSAKDLSSSKKNAKITGTISRIEGPYSSEKMSLGQGRYYVDGLLVENESKIDVAQPSKNGLHLAYLDVWNRHICADEDATLLEPALGGPDTTTRLKTEWQLRCRYLGAKDAFTFDEIRKRYCGVWPQLSSPAVADYWQLPLGTGRMKIDFTNFTRTENQLYRVEVHTGNFDENGEATTLKFKWSRDNGSAVATIKDINTTTKIITLADANLKIQNAFSDANFIEICDELCSRTNTPGYLVSADMTLIRDGKITLKENWGYERNAKDLEAPIIVRRWDGVQSTNNFELEDGLTVTFDTGDIYYRGGDYWLIPTRTDSVIGWENNIFQAAHGIEHHFAALALITKETEKCTFENLNIIFQPLNKGNVSKAGDTINGDLAVLGRLSVGSGNFYAPLSINADTNGKLMYLKASDETWHVNQGSQTAPSLRITDNDGNGLTLKKGGNTGIGTDDPKFILDVKANGRIKLGLEGMGGGQLQLACNPNDNKLFLEAYNSTGDGHAAEFLLTGRNAQNVPKLTLCADTTSISGNAGVGTVDPKAKLHVAGNAGILNLEGTDHAYIQWYPLGFSAGRKAWMGYGQALQQGLNDFNINNDLGALNIKCQTGVIISKNNYGAAGNLTVEGSQTIAGSLTINGNSTQSGALTINSQIEGDLLLDLRLSQGRWTFQQYDTGDNASLNLRCQPWGGSQKFFIDGVNGVGINRIPGGTAVLEINGNAAKNAGGTTWAVISDKRLKKNITPLNSMLSKLIRLRGVNFEWKESEKIADSPGIKMGLIAQEVEDVFPEWVSKNDEGYLYLQITGYEAVVIEAIKELDMMNKELIAKISKMEKIIENSTRNTAGE